jgi:hypothetical protein
LPNSEAILQDIIQAEQQMAEMQAQMQAHQVEREMIELSFPVQEDEYFGHFGQAPSQVEKR